MINLSNKKIGVNSPTFIIAEAGVNHNGNLKIAKELIDKAVEAGVDAVKFQTFKARNVVSEMADKVDYQKKATDKQETQYEMLKKLELSFKDHKKLIRYCNKKNVIFLSTPFCFETADVIDKLGLPLYKIGSSDANNLTLLKYIAQKDKPMILSTGMCNLSEVEQAIDTILNTGNNKLVVLHCVSDYPTKFGDVNLQAMDTIREAFNIPVGYSDHTLGIEIPIAAVARGAIVIEKHFTLDKNMSGPDHQASLEPKELKRMVKGIRNVEQSLGNGVKKPTFNEEKNMKLVRKSLITKKELKPGDILTKNLLEIKRPGTGISPKYFDIVKGMEIKNNLNVGEVLMWKDLKDE